MNNPLKIIIKIYNESILRKLFALSPEELKNKKQLTREWIEKNHTIAAAADQLWEKIYKHSPLKRKGRNT